MPKQSRRRHRLRSGHPQGWLSKAVAILAQNIMLKWAERRSVTRESGCFIRFIDEDKYNCAAHNLVQCTPYDAFTHPDWVVDWDLDLSAVEVDIVRCNMHNFAEDYKRD